MTTWAVAKFANSIVKKSSTPQLWDHILKEALDADAFHVHTKQRTHLTTGQSLFKSTARGPLMQIGLDHVEHFSSEAGVPVYKDHQYELVSVYDNTSQEEQDSMAIMFLYMLDKEFVRPAIP